MTPARGLGASKLKGDDAARAARQKAQAKADRVAAAKDRAASGEDRVSKLIKSVQEEVEIYDVVLEYLMSEGHADTIAEAEYIMTELDSEMIDQIVEEVFSEDANYDRNRRRAAQRAAL